MTEIARLHATRLHARAIVFAALHQAPRPVDKRTLDSEIADTLEIVERLERAAEPPRESR